MPEKYLFTGKDWRIGWQAQPQTWQGLIGGDNWGFELSLIELEHFCQLAIQLQAAIADIESELADQEELACTAEIAHLRLEVQGIPPDYSWYVCLECTQTQRHLEGSWPAEAMTEFLEAISTIHTLAGFNSDCPPCDDALL